MTSGLLRNHLLLLCTFAVGVAALAVHELVLIGSTTSSTWDGAASAFAMVMRKGATVLCAATFIAAHSLVATLLARFLEAHRHGFWLAHLLSGLCFGSAACVVVQTQGFRAAQAQVHQAALEAQALAQKQEAHRRCLHASQLTFRRHVIPPVSDLADASIETSAEVTLVAVGCAPPAVVQVRLEGKGEHSWRLGPASVMEPSTVRVGTPLHVTFAPIPGEATDDALVRGPFNVEVTLADGSAPRSLPVENTRVLR